MQLHGEMSETLYFDTVAFLDDGSSATQMDGAGAKQERRDWHVDERLEGKESAIQ